MPVQSIKMTGKYLDGTPYEITKPVYWCKCGAMASFGKIVMKNGHKVREWFCGRVDGKSQCIGKGNGAGQ